MLLRILILTSFSLISPSLGNGITKDEFDRYMEDFCFKSDDSGNLINGQEKPLSQTLENFIAMAEKFEAANSRIGLQETLFYFIRNFTYDNFMYVKDDVIRWKLSETNFQKIDELWEPDEATRKRNPTVEDPFTDAEKCSIFFMLSHSIVLHPRQIKNAPTNSSRSGRFFNEATLYPQETGVVSIRGSEVAVALGKVILGMYVGLNRNGRKTNDENVRKLIEEVDPNAKEEDKIIDPVYVLTMGEVISIANWPYEEEKRRGFAPDGIWVSTENTPDQMVQNICPMVYFLDKLNKDVNSSQSYSSLRGAADGLILGNIIDSVVTKKSDIKLSQILRMYYSRAGISVKDDDLGQVWASFCNRGNIIHTLEATIYQQTFLYQLLITEKTTKLVNDRKAIWTKYVENTRWLSNDWNTGLRDYCKAELSVDKAEDLPLESPLDITVVLDQRKNEDDMFKKQQMVVGYFAKQMELRYAGSRLTILINQKLTDTVSAKSGTVVLKPIVTETYSSACAACMISQISLDTDTTAEDDEVIVALDQLMQAKKDNETKQNGVRGKVVVYFNFKEDGKNSRPTTNEARVEKALREFHSRHRDVTIFVLGRAPDVVKKYVKNDAFFAISTVDEAETIANNLFSKVTEASATLQYNDCEEGRNENSASYEDYVSRNAIQHWEMPAKYFYKSGDISITFESFFGAIRVCDSVATRSPELQKDSCDNGNKVEKTYSNPCKSLTALSCPSFYFSILGLNATDETKTDVCTDTNTDTKCRTMDQIKFRITHKGIRCSGSSALITTPIFILLSIFLVHDFSKRY